VPVATVAAAKRRPVRPRFFTCILSDAGCATSDLVVVYSVVMRIEVLYYQISSKSKEDRDY